jgi:DNA primase
MIPDDIIENIKLSNNIEFIVSEYLPNLKKIGRNFSTFCPFHDEKTPSFIVSPEKNIFKCFGCNKSGDVFKFVMLIENISWIESVKKLAKRVGVNVDKIKSSSVTSDKIKVFDILKDSAMFYHECLLKDSCNKVKEARSYLENKRGIEHDSLYKFKIGYSIKGKLLNFLYSKNHKLEFILKSGVFSKTSDGKIFEYMSDRIVFPIFDIYGKVLAFGGRSISSYRLKYLNTPETIVYSKSANLYGLYQSLRYFNKHNNIIVLEGYIDVIVSHQFGITSTVSCLGTSFTKKHANLILRYCDNITLLFDSDIAGINAVQRALEIFVENNVLTYVSFLPKNIDSDEYLNKFGKEKFLKLVKNTSKNTINFMIYKLCNEFHYFKNKKSSEIKSKIIYNLLKFVLKNPNAIIQKEWIKDISQYFNIDEEFILIEFKNIKKLKSNANVNKKLFNDFLKIDKFITLEESLLKLVLYDKNYLKKIDKSYFKDGKCYRVFNLLVLGFSDSKILNKLPLCDVEWFSDLILNEIKYDNIENVFNIILRDIKINNIKLRRYELEKKIINIDDSKNEKNIKVFNEYKRLTSILKGSKELQ